MTTDLCLTRAEIAALLWALGLVPFPVRYVSRLQWDMLSRDIRQLHRLDARRHLDRIERLVEKHLDDFNRPCGLEVLTGSVSSAVAVNAWSAQGELWVYQHLLETPMVLETDCGMFFLYRHPGRLVATRHHWITESPRPTFLRVFGDAGWVSVPPAAHAAILEWPSVSTLPEFDPAWFRDDLGDECATERQAKRRVLGRLR